MDWIYVSLSLLLLALARALVFGLDRLATKP